MSLNTCVLYKYLNITAIIKKLKYFFTVPYPPCYYIIIIIQYNKADKN